MRSLRARRLTMQDLCRYCNHSHDEQFLCTPAKRVLDALLARGQRFDLPTIEFPEAVHDPNMFGEDTVLVAGLTVKAGVVEVAGTPQPVLVLTGNDLNGKPLPNWIYAASVPDMKRMMKLVNDMGVMAIRRARGM